MAEEIGNLKIKLGLDSSGIDRPLASVERNLKSLGGELGTIRNKGKQWGDSLQGLKTKQEVLGRTLTTQEVKVKKLREAYEKSVREKGEDAAATEKLAGQLNRAVAEYTRTETELEGVNRALSEQQAELRHAESGWGKLESAMETTGDRLTKAGDAMKGVGTKMTMGVTAPLVALGTAGFAAANNLDEAYKTIRVGTGATGDSLEDLKSSFHNVFANVPESAEEVSTALADLNTRTGLTGKALDQATEQFLTLGRVSGEDVPSLIEKGTRAFGDWGIAVEDQAGTMDYFWKVSQTTGIGVTDLMNKMVQFGAPLRQMGFDFETSAALLGKFEKEGVNAELVMGSMRQALGKMAKEGIDAETGLEKTMEAIKGAGSASEANAAAIELFGARAGPDMAAAVREGRFEIDDLIGTLKESEETIGKAGEETITFGERMLQMKNKTTQALEPIGDVLIDMGEKWIPKLEQGVEKLTNWFEDLGEEGQESAVKIGIFAAAAGPALVVVGSLATGLGSVVKFGGLLAGTIGRAGGAGLAGRIGLLGMTGPVGLAVAGVGLLAGGIYAVTKASELNVEESVKAIQAKQDEIAKNDELIANYDSLRRENRLSNDEMLRFLDIQALLEETTAPDSIAALKEEQAKLLEKSTLTNDEMNNFLGLNQEVIDAAPATVKAISSEGEAFAMNTDALRELNAEKAKEMENDARELLTESLQREKGLLEEQKELIAEINEANSLQAEQKEIIRSKAQEISGIESEIKDLEEQKNGASVEQSVELDKQIRKKEELLWQAGDEKVRAEELLGTYGKQMSKKDEELEKNRQSLAQADAAKYKYEEIILAQAGITSEKGRGLDKINEEIGKLETQKGQLRELLKSGQVNTAEYQAQNNKIDTQIGKLNEAKGELTLINDVAGKTVYKDVKISESPKGFWDTLDANLRRQVTKTVSIKYNARSGPQDMGMYGYADGTNHHPGGLALVGDGTGLNAGRELMQFPNGKTALSPEKPTILDLPKGTSVLSALNTKKLFGQIPQYANGTPDMQMGGMNTQVIAEAITNAVSRIAGQQFQISPAAVNISGQQVGEITFDVNQQLFGAASNESAWMRGVKG